MRQATKVRLYPTAEQADFLNRQFGAVRFVYNKALHILSHRYRVHGQSLNAKHDMKKLLPVAKRSRKYGWLREADSMALQQACINLDRAFQNFFNPQLKARYPRFKRKHGKQSSYHCVGIQVGEGAIKVPTVGPIKARLHRSIDDSLKSLTLTRTTTGKYFASILVETGEAATTPIRDLDAEAVTGLDAGLSHLVIDSSGRKLPNPRFLLKAAANVRRKQKALSRCQKGSRRRAKARLKVAKAHERLANARANFQHQLSRRLIDDNQAVIVETLRIANLLKNKQLAKHIADAALGGLIQKLAYKAERAGKHLVKLDAWYPSSKTCFHCGHKAEAMPLSVRTWDCPVCGTQGIDRDINAARNIRHQGIIELKAAGLSVSAHGGGISPA
ncbi:transposase [Halomonas sp. I5-271120]|uniref:RNA-guided endonuclease InsQ/TnpB family protein n=1 Tax=Halomonas sp. I5-271120 TaxID=3061632 RepID=UPI002714DE49|nr:transposase [Halomonas sp. I5-271120]